MGIASLINSALRRTVRILNPDAMTSYSQEGEDLVLRRFLEGRGCGFYVDVGAHHPSRFSNTCFFYEQGWRGINIEPAPEAIVKFMQHRPRDINLQFGVAETAATLTYYIFDEPALNTFDPSLAREREASTPYRLAGTQSIAVERLDVLLKNNLPDGQPIDFMNIDVEGLDLQVLRSNDWSRYRPDFVLVEALRFKLEQAGAHPMHAFMRSQRYELVGKTLNTLFYRATE